MIICKTNAFLKEKVELLLKKKSNRTAITTHCTQSTLRANAGNNTNCTIRKSNKYKCHKLTIDKLQKSFSSLALLNI
jgi:hypothetical protein